MSLGRPQKYNAPIGSDYFYALGGHKSQRVVVFVMPIMSQNPLCTVNKQFFSQCVSGIHFQPASVFLKGRMGAAIAPSWATNIPHFKITTGPGGMMIERSARVTPPTIEYCFLKTECQSLLVCFVASRTFWDGIWL